MWHGLKAIERVKGWYIYDRDIQAAIMPERRGRTAFEGAEN